ncbi:hypothetical protein HIM_04922 [Hirsutella minnesotensis 3608]|uniref:Rho-GAP domain-containing protein n=1 Tax=Hirsutella minnesotensis 3608 TaxID=1043627 RepID=A0A0F7ZPM6_9HYPO|nr:hypothetical protein HIM_04922 [Hirsutella minnesotensis 3608]
MVDRRDSGGEGVVAPPPQPPRPQRQRTGSQSAAEVIAKPQHEADANGEEPPSPKTSADGINDAHRSSIDSALAKQVEQVTASELGIPTLLNRLKQSIASAKEFAAFLRRRSTLEDEHAQGLKKLCRANQDMTRRPEHRQGSFAKSYDEMIFIHDRMAENGAQFAASLQQMHEDLAELAATAERGRKSWKAAGMAAEQKVVDLEQAMRKSKAKYDSLADEYDRARTGESRQSGKMLGAFKAHRSAAQQEEDLLKKVQAADQVYQSHVTTLVTEKSHLLTVARPEAVKALQDIITETDAATTMLMQKFAASNEKLLLGDGLIVSPQTGLPGSTSTQARSLRDAVAAIDNKRDLDEYLAAHFSKIQPKAEIKYERNPILNPPQQQHQQATAFKATPLNMHPPQSTGQTPSTQGTFSPPGPGALSRSSTGNLQQSNQSPAPQNPPAERPKEFPNPHGRSMSHGNPLGQNAPWQGNGSTAEPKGPPKLSELSFQDSQQLPSQRPASPPRAPQEAPNSGARAAPAAPPAYGASGQGANTKPIFGIPLNRLYERDGLAVPMVVYQCIQAVDLYGLGVEGIYRQSGSLNHINKLKGMFDADSSNPALDFRNPESFYHDVNSVTGLLKQFFRDLPDPILTMEHHDAFIAAAKKEDDVIRRDSLHAIINALPDPNYATLRALTLHLYRVMENSHVNRMNSHNLAVIFGPTLMGSDPSTAITDAGWQIKVIDTILQNTYQIFDED